MYTKEVAVLCESGLDTKKTALFVQKAIEFPCEIYLESYNRKMNAKSFLGILSLRIEKDETVTLSANGIDEQAAVEALEALLQRDIY